MKATEKIIFGFALVLLLGYLFNQTIHQFEIRSLSSLRGSLITLKGDNDTVRSYHLWCEGPPTKKVILIINGAGSVSVTQYNLLKELVTHYRTCVFDRPGRLVTPPSTPEYSVTDLLRDITSIINHIGNESHLVLVGHSLGGNIAALYALHYPNRTRGVVLLDPLGTSLLDVGGDRILNELSTLCLVQEIVSLIGLMRLVTVFKPAVLSYDLIDPLYHSAWTFHLNSPQDHRTAHFEFSQLCYHFVRELKNATETLLESEARTKERIPMFLVDAEHFIDVKIPGLVDSREWNVLWKKKQQHEVALKQLATQSTLLPYSHSFPQEHPKETAQLIFRFLNSLQ